MGNTTITAAKTEKREKWEFDGDLGLELNYKKMGEILVQLFLFFWESWEFEICTSCFF